MAPREKNTSNKPEPFNTPNKINNPSGPSKRATSTLNASTVAPNASNSPSDPLKNSNNPSDPFAQTWQKIITTLQAAKRLLLTGHENPDGDAIGSVLALASLLQNMDKEVLIYNNKEYPFNFHFLPLATQMTTQIPPTASFDVTVLCDCGALSRAPSGLPDDPARLGTLIVIDHHLTSLQQGDLNLNDPDAAAVGCLIYELSRRLHHPLSLDMAQNLYCSLICDTGNFRYQKTTPAAFRMAAELVEIGVDPWEMSSQIFESMPLERQRLLARALDTLEFGAQNRLATITLTREMYRETGATSEMTDGFINFARGIRGVEVAVLFREHEEGWRLSFRSRGKIDVSAIAHSFGGGGHHNAAGASLQGELPQAKKQILHAVERSLAQERSPSTKQAQNPTPPTPPPG